MTYSETRIVIGGLAHVPVLIFISNFIKSKFAVKKEVEKETEVKEEKSKAIKELLYKLNNIEEKANAVYEKVKKKKKDIKKD